MPHRLLVCTIFVGTKNPIKVMRQKIVAGNWKMNKTLEEANILASEIQGW
jgi:hypothetical protein